MKNNLKFLSPNSYLAFIGGIVSGSAFYASLYFIAMKYFHWPVERLLGPNVSKGISLDMGLYLMLYVLFFWGIILIFQKNSLVGYEYQALSSVEQNFQSSTIISKRAELDNLRSTISHGKDAARFRGSVIHQILLFLIDHCLVTQTSERVMEIFSRRMETLEKHVESTYNMLRYIAWAIPSIGFIGTVMGIGEAISNAGAAIENLEVVVAPLGMAFDTTLIALIQSIVLMYFIYSMQRKEENFLNSVDLFCQERFIINLRLQV